MVQYNNIINKNYLSNSIFRINMKLVEEIKILVKLPASLIFVVLERGVSRFGVLLACHRFGIINFNH